MTHQLIIDLQGENGLEWVVVAEDELPVLEKMVNDFVTGGANDQYEWFGFQPIANDATKDERHYVRSQAIIAWHIMPKVEAPVIAPASEELQPRFAEHPESTTEHVFRYPPGFVD